MTENSPKNLSSKERTISKHQHQADMMHMSWTIRWLVIAVIIGFVCMLGMAYIFVTGYTSRTKDWLATYQLLRSEPAITEVAHEEEKTGIVQQLPFR